MVDIPPSLGTGLRSCRSTSLPPSPRLPSKVPSKMFELPLKFDILFKKGVVVSSLESSTFELALSSHDVKSPALVSSSTLAGNPLPGKCCRAPPGTGELP